MTQTVSIQRDGPIVFLTMTALPRPSTVDMALCESLISALREIEATTSDRVVVLRGAGSMFSAGGNLQYIEQALGDLDNRLAPFIDKLHDTVLAMAHLRQPIIAAVHGAAAGAGFSLAMACDFVVATRSARFVSGYPRIGASCDGGLSFHLVRRLGRQRALNTFLLTESLDAVTAREWGVVDVLAEDADLDGQALAMAKQIASSPVQAISELKALVRQAEGRELAEHLQREKAAFLRCAATDDLRDRIVEFNARSRSRRSS